MGDSVSLSCFASKVFDKVFDSVVTYLVIYPITALYLCKQNVMKLKAKLGELAIRKMDLQHRVYEAQQRGEEILEEVRQWMSEVDKHISGSREELEKLECKARRKHCFGRCSNPKSLYDLSKKAEEYAGVADQLMQEAVQFNTGMIISYFHVQKQESIKRGRGAQDGFVEFKSRSEVLNKIMKALRSPTVNIIGVHGMLGMGKTMLVKEVKRKAEEEKLFDVVLMAKVTRNTDLAKFQYQIARGLGMFNLPKELTLEQVADRINEGLKKMNALVILDDVWEKIDLEDLGIPSGTKQKRPVADQQNKESSSREEQKECKVFITSRDPKVLSEKMGVKNDNIFPVNKLEDDEAMELFKLRIEDDIENSESRWSNANEIVNRCSGLPLAIEKMAVALRGKNDDGWSYLLKEIKTSKGGGYAVVCSAIEFSFSQLESEALKETFLLCCLLGHNTSIEDLMEYGTGLKLFPEVNKIEDARDAARTLVGNLKGSSLLLDGPSNVQFDMQDAVRAAATSIASRDRGVLASNDEDAAEVWPDEEAMKKLKWIYLSNADISQLLQELESVQNTEGGCQQVQCPQLTFLHLSNRYPFSETTVPADFFKGMKNLRVLSLTKMHFSPMPQSISLLTNLRTLRLNQSKLGVIEGMGEIIGKLKNLHVLNLAGCDITELPKEFACLTRLKLLDMSDCTSLRVISPDVLSKLSRLEEIKMANSFDQWQFIEQHQNQNGNASLVELKYLQKLTTLELELKAGSSYSSVIKLLKVSEELHLEGLHGVKNVVYQLDNKGFQKLRYLYVRNAPEIQFMIDSERLVCSNAFPVLEELVLQNLTKMEKICRELDVLGATSFNKLRILTIECCHQLKNLFSFSLVKQLLQLQEISLEDCENVEEIVAEEAQVTVCEIEEAATKIELGKVRSMRLEKLPNFISFCREKNSSITDQGGSRLTSFRCIPLFNEKVAFPMLEELQLTDIKIDRIWNTLATLESVRNLTKLIIVSCSDLKYLFSSSLANGLVKLLHLEVVDCKSLREIIATATGPEKGNI
ncbi:hypothetical protein SLEP1_g50650 [Rubroshorea leprosula]|uniref:AAA+ ATPase domain-containing protein n=1 Tax=Rubroshorea leprosula TaxID=152421 RepID=A0AAV5M469_9ROSI|nr:hypothetical protein SLEP1_g50650 [Rubroshorea leprosula]